MVLKAADFIGEETDDIEKAQNIFENFMKEADLEDKVELLEEIEYEYSFTLKAELTFGVLIKKVNEKTFQLEALQQGFRDLEQADPAFENLFEDIDLYSKKTRTNTTKTKRNNIKNNENSSTSKLCKNKWRRTRRRLRILNRTICIRIREKSRRILHPSISFPPNDQNRNKWKRRPKGAFSL